MRISIAILIVHFIICLCSCKKFVDISSPNTQLSSDDIFSNDVTSTGAQLAIYYQMETDLFPFYLFKLSALSSDELNNRRMQNEQVEVATNNLKPDNPYVHFLWKQLYKYIYEENAVLEGIEHSGSLSLEIRKQLKGEALFTRAYCYYLLIGFFGDVPWTTATDYRANSGIDRSAFKELLVKMSNDLQLAMDLLTMEYREGVNGMTTRRVRPNKASASALLARIRMWMKDWEGAEEAASLVINSTVYQLETDLERVFWADSREAIFQLEAPAPGFTSLSGYYLNNEFRAAEMYLQNEMPAIFQPLDKRGKLWVVPLNVSDTVYNLPGKYSGADLVDQPKEYTTLFRLAEMYIVRAEARIALGRTVDAIDDLNMVRRRAGLPEMQLLPENQARDSIRIERRRELFLEGDRWFDLRRTAEIDARMLLVKGVDWVITDQLYPIPSLEIEKNGMLRQNPGY